MGEKLDGSVMQLQGYFDPQLDQKFNDGVRAYALLG